MLLAFEIKAKIQVSVLVNIWDTWYELGQRDLLQCRRCETSIRALACYAIIFPLLFYFHLSMLDPHLSLLSIDGHLPHTFL